MKVLAYSGATPQHSVNGWVNLTGPMIFDQVQSVGGSQTELEAAFGLATQPNSAPSVINTTNHPLVLSCVLSVRYDGTRAWNSPLALGVFTSPIGAGYVFDANSMVAAQSFNYQHTTGNVATLHTVLPTMLEHGAFYFCVGAYNDYAFIKSFTVKFVMA